MITTYVRSSSLNNWKYCQLQYFITYVLGHYSPSGKKADLGTITHAVFETLAICKKRTQAKKLKKMKVTQEPLGDFSFGEEELYTDAFVYNVLNRSFDYYKSNCTHNQFNSKDYDFCEKMVWDTLGYNNGQFDPRNRTIIDTEPHFDIPINEPWAKFSFEGPDGPIEGNLAIKGTIDLITELPDRTIEVIDWKGLPVNTPIPTTTGWKTMGDLTKDDIIFDKDGNQTRILAKSKKSFKKCYEIEFDDKTKAICDDEHLWMLDNNEVTPIKNLKVGDKINIAKSLQTNDAKLPIDPYVLGLWLGDGRNRSAEITSGDEFIFNEIQRRGYEIGDDQEKRFKHQSRTVLKVTKNLKLLNLINNKHIPIIYLRASHRQRLDLLKGLMDSDGNVNKKRKQAVFTTCNKKLSDDVKELLLSLGQRVNQSTIKRSTNFKEDIIVYPLAFRPININPFLLPRKAESIDVKWGHGRSNKRVIKKITLLSTTLETQCIMVDSPTNTYLCTENMIPTHNTGQRLDWATGERKDYDKLMKDTQLLLYYYAISKVYPKYSNIIMTIFFCRDGGPFSLAFDSDDMKDFLETLRKTFQEIITNQNPKPVSYERSSFKCQKLCHYYKTNWPGTETTMCHHVENQIYKIGMIETVKTCSRPGFTIGTYQSPGEVQNDK